MDASRLDLPGPHGVRVTTEYSSLLADHTVHAVVVATPPSTHVDLALGALEAGKDVFVEKPMALSLEEALQLRRAADRTGRLVMVGHLLRYHSAFELIERWIASGELGTPRALYATRFGTAANVNSLEAWWALAPHDISIARMLFGRDPSHVTATEDPSARRVDARLDYGPGLVASLRVSGRTELKVRRLVIVTNRYLVLFDDHAARGELRVYAAPNRMPKTFEEAEEAIARAGIVRALAVTRREPLAVETERFVEAILDRTPVPTDVIEGCSVVAALDAGARSIRHGGASEPLCSLAPAVEHGIVPSTVIFATAASTR